SIPSRALAIAISRALTRPSLSRRARRRSSSEPISSRIDNADIVGPPPQTTTSATRKSFSMQLSWRVSLNSGRYKTIFAKVREDAMLFPGGFTFSNFLADVFSIFIFVLWFWLLITVFGDLFRRRDVSGWAKVIWV